MEEKRLRDSQESPRRLSFKKAREQERMLSFAGATKSPLTRVIIPGCYLEVVFDATHLNELREVVWKKVEEDPEESTLPRFGEMFLKNGAIVVVAEDEFLRGWLEELAEGLRLGGKEGLKVAGTKVLQQYLRVQTWIPGPKRPATVNLQITPDVGEIQSDPPYVELEGVRGRAKGSEG